MRKSKRHPDIEPAHPGQVIAIGLEETGIKRMTLAAALGVSSNTLYKLLEGKQAVTAEMAVRLEAVWGSTAETWLNLQMAHDLWKAQQSVDKRGFKRIKVIKEAA